MFGGPPPPRSSGVSLSNKEDDESDSNTLEDSAVTQAYYEDPQFGKVSIKARLDVVQRARPKGPKGRKLPTRYRRKRAPRTTEDLPTIVTEEIKKPEAVTELTEENQNDKETEEVQTIKTEENKNNDETDGIPTIEPEENGDGEEPAVEEEEKEVESEDIN